MAENLGGSQPSLTYDTAGRDENTRRERLTVGRPRNSRITLFDNSDAEGFGRVKGWRPLARPFVHYRITTGARPKIPRFPAIHCAGRSGLAKIAGFPKMLPAQGLRWSVGWAPGVLWIWISRVRIPSSTLFLILCRILDLGYPSMSEGAVSAASSSLSTPRARSLTTRPGGRRPWHTATSRRLWPDHLFPPPTSVGSVSGVSVR